MWLEIIWALRGAKKPHAMQRVRLTVFVTYPQIIHLCYSRGAISKTCPAGCAVGVVWRFQLRGGKGPPEVLNQPVKRAVAVIRIKRLLLAITSFNCMSCLSRSSHSTGHRGVNAQWLIAGCDCNILTQRELNAKIWPLVG